MGVAVFTKVLVGVLVGVLGTVLVPVLVAVKTAVGVENGVGVSVGLTGEVGLVLPGQPVMKAKTTVRMNKEANTEYRGVDFISEPPAQIRPKH